MFREKLNIILIEPNAIILLVFVLVLQIGFATIAHISQWQHFA